MAPGVPPPAGGESALAVSPGTTHCLTTLDVCQTLHSVARGMALPMLRSGQEVCMAKYEDTGEPPAKQGITRDKLMNMVPSYRTGIHFRWGTGRRH